MMMLPYDHIKEGMFNTFGDTFMNKIMALVGATFAATAVVLPFDNMKTRIQNSYTDAKLNRLNYNGSMMN